MWSSTDHRKVEHISYFLHMPLCIAVLLFYGFVSLAAEIEVLLFWRSVSLSPSHEWFREQFLYLLLSVRVAKQLKCYPRPWKPQKPPSPNAPNMHTHTHSHSNTHSWMSVICASCRSVDLPGGNMSKPSSNVKALQVTKICMCVCVQWNVFVLHETLFHDLRNITLKFGGCTATTTQPVRWHNNS